MYEDENKIEQINQPSESKWLKILMIVGSIIVGLSFLLVIYYGIIGILEMYLEIGDVFRYASPIGMSVFDYLSLIGIIFLTIGYIGLSRLTKGSAKITLLIGAIIFILLLLISTATLIVGNILVSILSEEGYSASVSMTLSIVVTTALMFKFLSLTIGFIVVSFTRSKLNNEGEKFSLLTISSFIMPLWIISMIVSFILMILTRNGEVSSIIFLSSLIAFSLNQIAYTIEFSIKASKV